MDARKQLGQAQDALKTLDTAVTLGHCLGAASPVARYATKRVIAAIGGAQLADCIMLMIH